MAFNAVQKNIFDLFNRNTYCIPRNQRRYVWDKRNWEELFDDISYVIDEATHTHFLGSFVLNDDGRKEGLPQYTIIDGQQRIITLTILLSSILFWFRKENLTEDFNGTKQYLIANDDKAKAKVMVRSEYHLSLESIIMGIINMDDNEFRKISISSFLERAEYSHKKDKSIVDAYKYFLTTIKGKLDKSDDKQAYLVALRNATVDISYISIISTSEEDSYTIFEILNARGMILEDHELLKNYIMRYIRPEENRDQAKMVWMQMEDDLGSSMKRFIKHYATHKCGYSKERDISEYKRIQQLYKGRDTEALLKDLRKKSEYYKKMINPVQPIDADSTEYRILSFFKNKRQEQLRPVILSLMHQNAIGRISEPLYIKVLTFIYNFYVCYNVIGEENSNKLTNVVYKYAEKIENQYTESLLKDFVADLKGKLPSEYAFLNVFKGIGWSHHTGYYDDEKNKDRVQTVLEVLERHLNNGVCLDNYTIEHVLDDAESQENGLIGNLIPLEESINKNLRGKSFSQKIIAYSNSNYKTARSFASRYRNEVFDPSKRTEFLAKMFFEEVLDLNFE